MPAPHFVRANTERDYMVRAPVLARQEAAGSIPAIRKGCSSAKMSLHILSPIIFYVVRSLTGSKRRTVDAESAGSSPVGPPSFAISNLKFEI